MEAARVSLVYLDGSGGLSGKITDRRDSTNSRGEAYLTVSPAAMQSGKDLRVEVEERSGKLVVYKPADGQLPTTFLVKPVTVELLPKGSAALLGDAQIEAIIRRLSIRSASLERRNDALQGEMLTAQSKKAELSTAITKWAVANGFGEVEATEKVQQWAKDIERQAAQKSTEQQALAAFALKNYGIAGQLFESAAVQENEASSAREKQIEQLQAEIRHSLLNKVMDASQSANS